MAARTYNLALINVEAVEADLRRYGITKTALSRMMGRADMYVSGVLSRKRVERDIIADIAKAMNRKTADYIKTEPEEVPYQNPYQNPYQTGTQVKISTAGLEEKVELLTKHIDIQLSEVKRKQDMEFKALQEQTAALTENLEAIHNKLSSINTFIARQLALWEGGKK